MAVCRDCTCAVTNKGERGEGGGGPLGELLRHPLEASALSPAFFILATGRWWLTRQREKLNLSKSCLALQRFEFGAKS